MANEGVQLLGAWYSPFVRRVMWALKLKGIEYDYVEEDLKNKSPLLLRSNPVEKRVPVLIHRGKPIPESLVILEYIDGARKDNPLLPADPLERAKARFWAKFADNEFAEVVRQVLLQRGEQQEKEVEKAKAALEILEGELGNGRKFFAGEKMGFVDIVLGWAPYFLGTIEEAAGAKVFDPDQFPLLERWMKTMMQVPLITENLLAQAKLVEGFKLIRK